MYKLVDDSYNYEKVFKLDDEPEDKCPVFVLRKLSASKKDAIDDQVTVFNDEKDSKGKFKGGTARRLKIDAALVDWRNVFDSAGQPVPCTPENKGKITIDVQEWLEDEIDGKNKLKGLGAEETKN